MTSIRLVSSNNGLIIPPKDDLVYIVVADYEFSLTAIYEYNYNLNNPLACSLLENRHGVIIADIRECPTKSSGVGELQISDNRVMYIGKSLVRTRIVAYQQETARQLRL